MQDNQVARFGGSAQAVVPQLRGCGAVGEARGSSAAELDLSALSQDTHSSF